MFPLRDNVPTRRRPWVTYGLIVANVLFWILYQDAGTEPGMTASLRELAYQPCEVDGSCRQTGEDWEVTEDVLHGQRSAAWDQAENRLHAQKALMALVIR